jgi:2-polyprenyl-3-methyl-5-hydroxy-6-metoxy-1,4-benzoquinol methylase
MPAVRRIVADGLAEDRAKRAFDLGCGNGATAQTLAAEGWEVAGVHPSEEGIAHACASGRDLRGRFPFVLCLEVLEHVYFPHRWAALLRWDGTPVRRRRARYRHDGRPDFRYPSRTSFYGP